MQLADILINLGKKIVFEANLVREKILRIKFTVEKTAEFESTTPFCKENYKKRYEKCPKTYKQKYQNLEIGYLSALGTFHGAEQMAF